jgi:AcrR family transcriptional regulator
MGERVDGRSLRYRHRRGELLVAVGEYVLENGVASLTLRRAAEAVGVTHATLQHHFGTREQLLEEIIEHLLERSFAPGEDYPEGVTVADVEVRLRAFWASLNTPTGQQDIRLFTEVLVQGLYSGPGSEPAVTRSITQRLERIAGIIVSLGCPEAEAMSFATAMLALLRGITLDLLATGEDERVQDTFELFLSGAMRLTLAWEADRDRAAV